MASTTEGRRPRARDTVSAFGVSLSRNALTSRAAFWGLRGYGEPLRSSLDMSRPLSLQYSLRDVGLAKPACVRMLFTAFGIIASLAAPRAEEQPRGL